MSYNKEDFCKDQPVVSKLFYNSIKNSRIANAYLMYGEPSAPILESAMFIAKSLECQASIFACCTCDSCKRFEEGTHPDFILIDGSKGLIKKSDIDELNDFFTLSALEKGHRGVYIINHIENITNEAINALLKILEEPEGDITALLTTDNRDKVLKTILSRCEQVSIKSPDISAIAEAYKGKYSLDRYYVVSNMAYSEQIKEDILDSKEFSDAYDAALSYIEALSADKCQASYVLIGEAASKLKGNKCYNYFYSILSIVFSDAAGRNENNPLKESVISLEKYGSKLIRAISLLDTGIAESQANMNFTFMLARLAEIMEE